MSAARMCLGCRGRDDKTGLIRITASQGSVVVDQRQRQPGRGAYLHPDLRCVEQAVARRQFGRALRSEVDTSRAGTVLRNYLGMPRLDESAR